MEESSNVAPKPQGSPTLMIKVGKFALTGGWAIVVQLLLLTGIVALVIYLRPSIAMLLSAAIWIGLSIFWSIAEQKKAPSQSAETPESRRRHQLLLNLALLLVFLPFPGLTQSFLPRTLASAVAGLSVQAASVLFYFWAWRNLGRWWSGAVRIREGQRIVRSGPYRVLRHPMYTAMMGMYAGSAIVSGRYLGLIGVAVAAIAYWRKIQMEERVLQEAFGEAYGTYRKETSALIPWIF